jgi:tol-pal system protein YbgF
MNIINVKNVSFFLSSVLCLLCSALILTGCATTEDVNRTQYDTNLLKTEVRDIKEKISSPLQKEKLDVLDKKLQELQGTQESTSKTVSDLMIQFQSLTAEFRVLTGRFEESRYYAEKNSAGTKEEKEKLTAQLKDFELSIDDLKKRIMLTEKASPASIKEETKEGDEKGAVAESNAAEKGKLVTGTEKVQETEKKTEENKAPKQDVKDVYLAGYKAFKDGKTADARAKLTSVIKDYPENEYSDNSRFWIAESYYKEGNYEDAILTYEELLKKNPKSDKVSGAMLKQGLSFYALKDKRTGRIILEKLIEQFPNSEQAQTAKKKIGTPTPSKKK